MANVMKPVSEKSLVVLDYLKGIGDENVTAKDIAAALDMTDKAVNGVVTSGLIRNKNLAERIQAEITLDDGTHQTVKFIKLTDAGKNYDHAAVVAAYEAAQADAE